jgi:hypothetical protein
MLSGSQQRAKQADTSLAQTGSSLGFDVDAVRGVEGQQDRDCGCRGIPHMCVCFITCQWERTE